MRRRLAKTGEHGGEVEDDEGKRERSREVKEEGKDPPEAGYGGGVAAETRTEEERKRDKGPKEARVSECLSSFSPSGHQFEAPAGHPSQPESNEITRIYIL